MRGGSQELRQRTRTLCRRPAAQQLARPRALRRSAAPPKLMWRSNLAHECGAGAVHVARVPFRCACDAERSQTLACKFQGASSKLANSDAQSRRGCRLCHCGGLLEECCVACLCVWLQETNQRALLESIGEQVRARDVGTAGTAAHHSQRVASDTRDKLAASTLTYKDSNSATLLRTVPRHPLPLSLVKSLSVSTTTAPGARIGKKLRRI